MSTSGHGRPESTSDRQPSQWAATTRGDSIEVQGLRIVRKGRGKHLPQKDRSHYVEQVPDEVVDSWKLRTEPINIIGPEDILRTKLMWMTFGLALTLLLGSLVALVAVASRGASPDGVLDFLKLVVGPVFWPVSVVVAFYFGRTGRAT